MNWIISMKDDSKLYKALSFTKHAWQDLSTRRSGNVTHKKGDLALAVKRPMVFAHKSKGKFEPKWEGPFVIHKVFSSGAYALLNMEGDICMLPINDKFLKRYYP